MNFGNGWFVKHEPWSKNSSGKEIIFKFEKAL